MDSDGVINAASAAPTNTNNEAPATPADINMSIFASTPESTKKPNPFKAFFKTLGNSSLFMGKRKFITIPALLLALASVITLAVVLIVNLTSEQVVRLDDSDSVFLSEFTEIRNGQWYRDMFFEIQDLVDESRVDDALAAIDKKIAAETDDVKKSVLILEKSYVAANDGRFSLAMEAANQQIEIFKVHNENLETSYGYLAWLYELSGDTDRAIEYYQLAIDNASPVSLEVGYWQVKIIELNGAEDE